MMAASFHVAADGHAPKQRQWKPRDLLEDHADDEYDLLWLPSFRADP